MNITRHEIDNLNTEITISVSPNDYEEKVTEGIKKVQRQAQMPGFRPGKVPAGLIKKQYGTQIMVDEINKLLNDSIYKYIEENKIEILGNPLPKDQTSVDFSQQKDFEFVYQLGLAPDFKVTLGPEMVFTYKTVKIDEALVDKYIKDVRRNYGKPVNPEVSGEKDIVFVDINELDENGTIKAGGVFKSTSVSYERIKNESAKAKLLGLKREDKIVLNVDALYESDLDKSVSLGIDKETAEGLKCDLQLTVKNISKMDDAPLDQELFDKVYGPGAVNSEEEFRGKIRHELELMFSADADRFFKGEVENKLLKNIDPRLPDSFLKKWLAVANEKPVTSEEIEKDYPGYSKAMQWRLIENKIIKEYGLQVSADEAKEEARNFIRSEYARYGQQPTEEDLDKISKDLLSKEKDAQRIFEKLYSKKVLDLVKEKCSIETTEVGYDEFFRQQ